MTPAIPLSAAARRTGDSPISDLMARALAAPDLISLAAGFVDHATLPVNAASRAIADILGDNVEGHRALQYGTTRGDVHLRHRLIQLLEKNERVPAGAFAPFHDRLVVTTGSQQLLYLVAEVLLDPGDIVLVESPTYFVFMGVLQSLGATILGVPTDEGGLRIDALEATLADLESQGQLHRVKLIYTISEHSNPTGLSLEADRRRALVEVARSWSKPNRIFILEDAAYRGLTFTGDEPPSVWSQDDEGQTVILARTFSKTFSPGLRIGYGVLPDSLVPAILAHKGNHDFGSPHFAQQVLDRVLADGLYEPQVALLAKTYRRKAEVMLDALDEHFHPFGGAVSWTRPKGGLYVWLTLPDGVDTGRDGDYFAHCLDEGVLYVPGAYAYPMLPGPFPNNQARLTFGVTPEPGLVEGVRRLASALAKTTPTARRSAATRKANSKVTSG